MRVTILALLGLASSAVVSGFTTPAVGVGRQNALKMSSTEETGTEVPIIITGKNIEVTPALTDYVNKKIGTNLNKLTSNGAIRECDVQMYVNKNPKVRYIYIVLSSVWLLKAKSSDYFIGDDIFVGFCILIGKISVRSHNLYLHF